MEQRGFIKVLKKWVDANCGVTFYDCFRCLADEVSVGNFSPAQEAKEVYNTFGYCTQMAVLIDAWCTALSKSAKVRAEAQEVSKMCEGVFGRKTVAPDMVKIVENMQVFEIKKISALLFALFDIYGRNHELEDYYAEMYDKLQTHYGFDWYIVV